VFKKGSEKLNAVLAGLVRTVERFAPWVVILSIVLTLGLLYYTAENLGINSDTEDMLSKTLHFRRISIAYDKAFPQFNETILIVIDGDTMERAQAAASTLVEHLKRAPGLFKTVYAPGSDPFFEKNGLLYLDPDELSHLADNLAAFQPFLAIIRHDPSLRGLFSILQRAVEAQKGGEAFDLSGLFTALGKVLDADLDGHFRELSWQELMQGHASSAEDRRQLIVVQPKLDYDSLLPGEKAMQAIRHMAGQLALDPRHGIRVRLTGDIPMAYEELLSVSRGAGIAGLLALVFVGILLFAGLGSPRLVGATLVTLAMGLVWTGGFAAAAVGHLNLISVAFAALYIGLSVDYAIHFCLRYRELIDQGQTHSAALEQTARDVGGSLVLCCITTAVGFYAFIPTSFLGVAELGIISGTSMIIALIANLTVLPALLSLMPYRSRGAKRAVAGQRMWRLLMDLPGRHVTAVRSIALAAGLTALLLMPGIVFDPNPLDLRDPGSESVMAFRELLSGKTTSPWFLTALAPDQTRAGDLAHRLDRLKPVENCITLKDFIPARQDQKLAIIDEMGLLLGPGLMTGAHEAPPSVADELAGLHRFMATLKRYIQGRPDSPLAPSARQLLGALTRYDTLLGHGDVASRGRMFHSLERRLLGALPAQMERLRTGLSADKITEKSLPPSLVERWVAKDGRYRVQVMPRADLNDNAALRRFVRAVQTVAPDAVGFPVILLEAGDAVVSAFQEALALSLVLISLLLFILMRRLWDPLMILVSILLAGVLTCAAMVVFDIPFNFANVIALPLLLGIGVDSGIHIVHRIRTAPPEDGRLSNTSTARAIFFSTLTTIGGFGNLAFSPHRGMASMGKLLTIGILLTLICSVGVLPALITRRRRP
jgi:uncharacterized protein